MEDNSKKIFSLNFLSSDKKYEQEKIFFEDNFDSFINKVCSIFQIDDKYKDNITVTYIPNDENKEEKEISNDSEYQNLLNLEEQFITLNVKLINPSEEIKYVTDDGYYGTTTKGNNNMDYIYNNNNNKNELNNEIINVMKTEINKKNQEIKEMINNMKNEMISNNKKIETKMNDINKNMNELKNKIINIENKMSYNEINDNNNNLEDNLNKKMNELKKNYNNLYTQINDNFEKLNKKFDNLNVHNNNNFNEKIKTKKYYLNNSNNNNNNLNTNNNEEEDIKENSNDNLNIKNKYKNSEENSNFEEQQNNSKFNNSNELENIDTNSKKYNENKYQIDYEGVQKSFPFSFLEKGFCEIEIKITNNSKIFLPKDCYLCQILENNKKDGLMFKNTLINNGEEIAPNQQVKVKIKLLAQENFVKQNEYIISYEIKEHQLIQLNKEQSGLSQISFTGINIMNNNSLNDYKYQNFDNTPGKNNNKFSNYLYKNNSILDRNNNNNNQEEDIKENSNDNLINKNKYKNFEKKSNFEEQQNDSKFNNKNELENIDTNSKKYNENKYQIDYEGVQKSFPFSFLEKGFCEIEIKITNNSKIFLPKDCYLCQILENNKKDGLMFKNTLINNGEEIAPNQQVKVKIKLLAQENFVKQNEYIISYEIKEHQLIQLNKEQSGLSQISFTGIYNNFLNEYKYNQNYDNTPGMINNKFSNYSYKNNFFDRNNNNKKPINIINNENYNNMFNKYNLNTSNNNQKNNFDNLYDKYKNQNLQNNKKTENYEKKEYNVPLNNNKNKSKSQYKYGSNYSNKVYYDKIHFN